MPRKLFLEPLEPRQMMAVADFNADGTVDAIDQAVWKYSYGLEAVQAAEQWGDADGDGDVDGHDFLTVQREQGKGGPNLVAYRQISPTFPIRSVRENQETSATLGPGIRINYDDDDRNGAADAYQVDVAGENDLVRMKIVGPNMHLRLIADPQLSLFYANKGEPVPLEGGATEELTSPTVWVEWVSLQHGFANLYLVDAYTSQAYDAVRFHSFRSLIIAFGGAAQNPYDTDGDGSIGDRVIGTVGDWAGDGNREGAFDVAQNLYDVGYDVLAYNGGNDSTPDDPYEDLRNAYAGGFIERHAVLGYSQGGGAAHDLIEQLQDAGILTEIGVYLDAVDEGGAPETDFPDGALWLLSFYQEPGPSLRGGRINSPAGGFIEQYDVTSDDGWDSALNHYSIDDDLQVQSVIGLRITQQLRSR